MKRKKKKITRKKSKSKARRKESQEAKKEPTQKEIEKAYGPIGSSTAPPPEVINARRKRQYIVDPKDVAQKDDLRVRNWFAKIMSKNEHKLSPKCKDLQIIATGDVEPEDIDIRNIYPFKDLHWIIYKQGAYFHISLVCKAPKANNLIFLCRSSFAKVRGDLDHL